MHVIAGQTDNNYIVYLDGQRVNGKVFEFDTDAGKIWVDDPGNGLGYSVLRGNVTYKIVDKLNCTKLMDMQSNVRGDFSIYERCIDPNCLWCGAIKAGEVISNGFIDDRIQSCNIVEKMSEYYRPRYVESEWKEHESG